MIEYSPPFSGIAFLFRYTHCWVATVRPKRSAIFQGAETNIKAKDTCNCILYCPIKDYIYICITVQIIATSAEITPKWWFSKGIPHKMPLNSGLWIILICPECTLSDHRDHYFEVEGQPSKARLSSNQKKGHKCSRCTCLGQSLVSWLIRVENLAYLGIYIKPL